jgi:alpha/beta superfamily hydrolase
MQSFNQSTSACWIAGFSFGAWIGMQLLMRRPEINGFVSVAPPANAFDFTFLAPCPSSGLIVHGDQDEIVPGASVAKLVDKLRSQRNLEIVHEIIPGANHFFHDRLAELDKVLDSYLTKALAEDTAAVAR